MCVCAHVCTCYSVDVAEDNLQTWFSLFTIWVWGTDHRLSGLLAGAFTC